MPCHLPERLFGHRLYVCGVNGCAKTCSTRGGVKRHIRKRHLPVGIRPHLADHIEAIEADQDYDFDNVDPPWVDEPNTGAGQHPRGQNVSYHPLLDGTFNFVNAPSTYESRAAFQLAEFLYSHEQMSAAKIDDLLAIMAAMYGEDLPFHSHKDMYDTIDTTTHRDSPWKSFSVTYSGAIPDGDPPSWMTTEYDVWYCDPKVVLEHQLANPDFKGEIDYAAKVVIDEDGHREVCNLMSGQWAFEQSDMIAKDADTHGAMFVPVVLGSDKTTVLLTGVVQGWCPRCTARNNNLDGGGGHRSRELTEALLDVLDPQTLLNDYGIVHNIVPFTSNFPRADIHELIAPDLLHQLIKGTFKDHVVTWINEYLELVHGKQCASEIIADIDRRIAAMPSFPVLHHFPEGHGFKQWTGDDSKALMKVYLPAIAGHVPPGMVHALSTLLDFCYLVRLSILNEATLDAIDAAMDRFHQERTIFITSGVRVHLSLSCQHAMVHYCELIELFEHGMLDGPLLLVGIEAVRVDIEDDEGGVVDDDLATYTVKLASRPVYGVSGMVLYVADCLGLQGLQEGIRCFLYDQVNPDAEIPGDHVDLCLCPPFQGRVWVFYSAVATFCTPSDQSGVGGMRHEIIRATLSWQGGPPRYDCIYVAKGAKGVADEPDGLTGMWIVAPEVDDNGHRVQCVISLDSVVHGAHLIGVYGGDFIPVDLRFSDSLDAFKAYYVNKFKYKQNPSDFRSFLASPLVPGFLPCAYNQYSASVPFLSLQLPSYPFTTSRRGEDPPTPSSSKGKLPAVPPRTAPGSSSKGRQWQFAGRHGLTPVSAKPVTEAVPAVTTPVHVSPTFSTYRTWSPSFQESAHNPTTPEGNVSEEDVPIPTTQEEEIAEGLSARMLAGMSLQDPFENSNPTRIELENWYKTQFSKEVSGPPPEGFDGDHERFTPWMLSVRTYLALNAHVYDTDEKLIGFTLSYMTGGSALAFKENYIEGCIADGVHFYITESYAEFVQKLKNVYDVGDVKATSMLHLANIKQGNKPLAEYSSRFLLLMNRAGIKDGVPMGTFFGKGLSPFLSNHVLSLGIIPESVQDWIKAASAINNAKATKRVFRGTDTAEDRRGLYYSEQKATMPKKFRDPDAMVVDRGRPRTARPLECFIAQKKKESSISDDALMNFVHRYPNSRTRLTFL
ncbi:hypothetical protein SCLCIDRAFT_27590 [Scleroderma citrinum Foug A]|uniref:C2H2-type domain-containing protein n=1 Tax=Scleroderma citrinum Foug A TaxID=1036808 RepID=A0A0C3DS40_9AGAM|nr:hypothetical protein SCLCIDRAFT_27590 [Scleroderma citrinum Foug A]